MNWYKQATLNSPILLRCLFAAVLVFLAGEAFANQGTKSKQAWRVGDILVEQAWARISDRKPKLVDVYLTIHNASYKLEYLLGAESPNARSIGIFETKSVNGKARLNPIPGGLNLDGHREIIMRPDGVRLTLTEITEPPKPDGKISVDLFFMNAGALTIDVPVLPINAKDPPPIHKKH